MDRLSNAGARANSVQKMTLKGLYHTWRVRKDASRIYYYYAWKGGPLVWKGDRLPVNLTPDHPVCIAYAEAYASVKRARKAEGFVAGLVQDYRGSADYTALAPRTRQQWGMWLDRIVDEFGMLEVEGCDDRAFRGEVIRWRDQWRSTPRQADYAVQVMSRVLSYAKDHGKLDFNRATGIEKLYQSGQRSEIVWTEADIEAVCDRAGPEAALAIRLAAATGLRRGDLVSLRWSEIGPHEIVRPTNKSRGARTARIPILPETRAVLDQLKASRSSVTVLATAQGRPWGEGWLSRMVKAACDAAGVDKHLHDLRGTFATRLCVAGFTDEEVADVMGWSVKAVSRLRRVYVNSDSVAKARILKLTRPSGEQSGSGSV